MDFREQAIRILESANVTDARSALEVPPDSRLGDYAFPCFHLAKERKKAPPVIAQEIASTINAGAKGEFFERIVATGPYVNFFITPSIRAKAVLEAISEGTFWKIGQGSQRILVEFPSPNTNKPIHLGHVRNIVIGTTISRILALDGNTIIKINLTNDRGVHICKSMLAYQRWGNNQEPDKKSDHFVGDFYVLYAKKKEEDPKLEEEVQEMLVQWENNDPTTRELWKKMNEWALSGHQKTYERFGITFDKEYYESEIYKEGKDIVLQHKDLLLEEEGALIAPLEQYGLPNKVLLRKDGTTIYMTQDIALTMKKIEEFHPDLQIWVVGNEQNLHFQQLFATLELFGVKNRKSFFHFSYGMVELPEGKMKSREGTVIDADDILDEMEHLAREEIGKRHPEWDQERIREKANIVAMGAIRFFMIKFDPLKDFVFDPKSSLSFEGDSGPYLQYTHARICSVLAKATMPNEMDAEQLTAPEEQELLRQIALAPAMLRKAIAEYKLHSIAVQLLEIGRAFNAFYHACPVLTAPDEIKSARLCLLDATRRVLEEGLDFLGITAPTEM